MHEKSPIPCGWHCTALPLGKPGTSSSVKLGLWRSMFHHSSSCTYMLSLAKLDLTGVYGCLVQMSNHMQLVAASTKFAICVGNTIVNVVLESRTAT